jgi:hypothetical protein
MTLNLTPDPSPKERGDWISPREDLFIFILLIMVQITYNL